MRKAGSVFRKGGAGGTDTHGERGTGRAKAPGSAWELEHIHKKPLWLDLSDAMWFTKWQAFCKECLFALSCPVMGGWRLLCLKRDC